MPDDPDLRFAHLEQVLRDYAPAARERAARYFERQRISRIDWSDSGFSTRVQGDSICVNRWSWNGSAWKNTCTCDAGGMCEHGYAVGLLALQARDPEHAAQLVSPGVALPKLVAPPPKTRTPAPDAPVAILEQRLAAAARTRPTTAARRLCAQLASLFARRTALTATAAEEIAAFAAPGAPWQAPLDAELVLQALARGGATDDVLEFWQRLALALRHAGRAPVAELAPLVDEARLQRDLGLWQHERAVRDWRVRLQKLAAPEPAAGTTAPPPAAPRSLRVQLTPRRLVWQAAPPGGEFSEVPAAEILALVAPPPGEAAAPVPVPAGWDARALLLLNLFADALRAAGNRSPTLRDAPLRAAVARALLHPELHDAVRDAAGAPFTAADSRLVWKFSPDPERADYLRLALARADGAALPANLIHLAGPPHVYLADSVVWRGPEPLGDRPDAGWQVAVPAEAVRAPEVLRLLVAAGAQLPEELADAVEHVRLRPHVRVWLQENADGREEVRAVCSALDPRGQRRLALGGEGWTAKFRGAPAADATKALVYDHAETAATVAHFATLGLEWNREHGLWARPVVSATPDELVDWFAGFPPVAALEVAPELAALREGPIAAHYDFDVLENPTSRDWFDVQLAVRASDTTLTPEEIQLLLAAQGRWVKLAGRGWRRLALTADAKQQERITELGLAAAGTVPNRQRFHALQLAAAGLGDFLAAEAWSRVQARAAAIAAVPAPAQPAGLHAELRPYQHEGFHFLSFLASNGFGGILADDMGLGKTVQALAWLVWLAERAPKGKPLRALVVCPKSVTTNWERETARFAPGLGVAVFVPKQHAKKFPEVHLLVANYAQLRGAETRFLGATWDVAILDEGQNIKNPDSLTAGIARKLQAKHRLVLTGTPIENRTLDLWSLFAFAMPGLLGGQAQFLRTYDDKRDPGARGRLARRTRHFLLRRTKGQVATDLPPRIEEDVLCELEGEQLKLYQAELKRARALVLGVQNDAQLAGERFNILHSLLRLRQICCHPALLGGDHAATIPSAKVEALFDQLEPILEEGHKVLVFSQFVSMLELLRPELEQRGTRYLMLTGQTENRQELVDRFQADPEIPVFLLSLKAAGAGLNLTAASYVVLFDPWWNPAVEAQAIDRTHRIGQSNQVIAYRLIAKGTVEEKIRLLQQEKATLAREIVQEESLASVLDLASLRYVLG